MSAHQEDTGAPQTAGHAREPLQLVRRARPEILTAQDFLEKDLPPLKAIIPGLVPEGALLLAGAPKAGKSRLALSLAIAVAMGRPALGKIEVEQREVLYLCLEDGERMTQDRMRALQGEDPSSLYIAFDWPKFDAGCEIELERWLEEHPNAGLVVVDTLEPIRSESKASKSIYAADYAACAPLADLAHKYRICVMIVHHTRKARPEDVGDPMEKVSGSTGLTGAVDGVLVLERSRHASKGQLQLLHREMRDAKYSLTTDDETGIWILDGDAPQDTDGFAPQGNPVTPEQGRYIELLRERGTMRPKQIADALEKSPDAVRQMLGKLVQRQLIQTSGGLYWVPTPDSSESTETEPCDAAAEVGERGTHAAHSSLSDDDGHSDEDTHAGHAVDLPDGDGREQCEPVSTSSDIWSQVSGEEVLAIDDVDDLPRDREHVALVDDSATEGDTPSEECSDDDEVIVGGPPRWTPTSELPFKRGFRNPLALRKDAENISRRLDWDTGARTEVELTIESSSDDPGHRMVWLECGHGIIEEEVVYRPWCPTENRRGVDNPTLVRMALAHHAYMCACDCIRPLWSQYFGRTLTTAGAEQELWSAYQLMQRKGYTIQTRFHEPKWPPAPQWVVRPQETFDESEEEWSANRNADVAWPSNE